MTKNNTLTIEKKEIPLSLPSSQGGPEGITLMAFAPGWEEMGGNSWNFGHGRRTTSQLNDETYFRLNYTFMIKIFHFVPNKFSKQLNLR